MSCHAGPDIVENGLVFCYDMNNTQKSWKGAPTINLVGETMSIYNNVPSHVTAYLEATSEKYNGATIYKLTLTPTTSTGVSYLTAGNNPGLGVVSNGGGGLANKYTGHSIFFKPTVSMHSSPIFTHYSNIAGWQSTNNYYSMGDGWYRAHVIWYDTVDRSDGKYWAINPASATLNIPIITYFAGPFKEDRNDSTFVSPYTIGTRTNTQAILDLTNNNIITANNVTYNSDNTFKFNSSGQRLDTNITTFGNNATWEAWFNGTSNVSTYNMFMGRYLPYFGFYDANRLYFSNTISGSQRTIETATNLTTNTWYHAVFTTSYDNTNTTMKIYTNGVETASGTWSGSQGGDGGNYFSVGDGYNANWYRFDGQVPMVKIYNRALSAAEVAQNFNATRRIYGI